jgi:hypothetical protein
MATQQGDLALLDDPVAQELLHSTNLARLAYTWRDGTPRVIPIWFHWDGETIVLGSPPNAPKVDVLPTNSVPESTGRFRSAACRVLVHGLC